MMQSNGPVREANRPRWRSRVWVVAAVVVLILACAVSVIGAEPPSAVLPQVLVIAAIAIVVVLWAVLRTKTQRTHYEQELAGWAAEQATQRERLRIASELHDLVSHGLGVITVRAAVACALDEPDADQERVDALADIERVSRETTTELRRMLTVLRDPESVPLRPADTFDDLSMIVQDAVDAGLDATLAMEDIRDVSSGVQLAVCAVVREALSNSMRHAGPTEVHVGVRVEVSRQGREIVVDVCDGGPRGQWQPRQGAGHGLDALRERVAILGGTLHAQADAPGFRLSARIPDREL